MTPYGSDASHRRALVLSEVTAEGATGLSRVLRRAARGDRDAAQIRVSSLVRAVRPLGALDTHEFLVRSHIREADLAGDLTPGQRVALLTLVDRSEHFHDPRP
jgi:hypothetical protein